MMKQAVQLILEALSKIRDVNYRFRETFASSFAQIYIDPYTHESSHNLGALLYPSMMCKKEIWLREKITCSDCACNIGRQRDEGSCTYDLENCRVEFSKTIY